MEARVGNEKKRLEGLFGLVFWFYSTWTLRSRPCVFASLEPAITAAVNGEFTEEILCGLCHLSPSLSLSLEDTLTKEGNSTQQLVFKFDRPVSRPKKVAKISSSSSSSSSSSKKHAILTPEEMDLIKQTFARNLAEFIEKNQEQLKDPEKSVTSLLKEASKGTLPPRRNDPPAEQIVQNYPPVPFVDFEQAVSMSPLIENLKLQPWYKGQLKHQHTVKESAATFASDFPSCVHPAVVTAVNRSLGITRLYSHQVMAIEAVAAGKSVVVATPTSSGKSLVYCLPIFSSLVEAAGNGVAFCLYPTKALAQDQKQKMVALAAAIPDVDCIKIETYDGDTAKETRQDVREKCNVILTNPDSLHASILPNHRNWSTVLKRLKLVVLDELHSYHGTFGSHIGMILRRLRRLCALHENPGLQFVCSSATIGNPVEHLVNLTGVPGDSVSLVTEDGSPRGQKEMLLWDPPINEVTKQKQSNLSEVVKLFVFLLQSNVRTIVFCKNRKISEVITTLVHQQLTALKMGQPEALVQCYRGGYTPETRREIERNLFSGKMQGVIATNALELGIDIGCLDGVIHLGCPGSKSSLWQQAGRAGRRTKQSISIVVVNNEPLDQYFLTRPEELFAGRLEELQVDPFNPVIAERHLVCAAFEAPLVPPREVGVFGEPIRPLLQKGSRPQDLLVGPEGVLEYDFRNPASPEWPARGVSIRDIEEEHYEVVDQDTKAVLEELEVSRAMFDVFPGAVYLHKGKSHVIEEVDFKTRLAFAKRREVGYWTRPRDMTDIKVNSTLKSRTISEGSLPVTASFGVVEVTTVVFGYRKLVPMTNKLLEVVDLDLPPYKLETKALWLEVPLGGLQQLQLQGFTKEAIENGIHAASHCLCSLAPILVKCSPSDVRTECKSEFNSRDKPAILFVADSSAGGLGISSKLYDLLEGLITCAVDSIEACGCERGCPSCIWSSRCSEANTMSDKKAAVTILKLLVGKPLAT